MRIAVVNLKAGFAPFTGNVEYIGRGNRWNGRKASPLANQFKIGVHGTREQVVAKYEAWIRHEMGHGNKAVLDELIRLGSIAYKTGSLTIACWCAPSPCHGDVIKAILEEALRYEDAC